MFRNIVVGIDGSTSSENALKAACDIAQKYKARIHLVHTPQVETVAYAVGSGAVVISPTQSELDAAGEKVLSAAKEIVHNNKCETTSIGMKTGHAGEHIITCANNCDGDLIVTGRRGLGGIAGALLGSTSSYVAKHAACACLTVL